MVQEDILFVVYVIGDFLRIKSVSTFIIEIAISECLGSRSSKRVTDLNLLDYTFFAVVGFILTGNIEGTWIIKADTFSEFLFTSISGLRNCSVLFSFLDG